MNIPTWADSISTIVLAVGTIILAGATTYYAYQEKKKEEKRLKNKKKALRRVILEELYTNIILIDKIISCLEYAIQYHADHAKNPVLPSLGFPETTAYEKTIEDIGILGDEEVRVIMFAYGYLKNIMAKYKKFSELKEDAYIIEDIYGLFQDLVNENNFSSFYEDIKEVYEKLFKGEIDERQLEKTLKDIEGPIGI